MFDITSSKLLLLGIVALLVIGPKDFPALLRTIGKYVGIIRGHAREFRAQFDEAMRESEIADLKKDVENVARETEASFNASGRSIEQSFDEARQSIETSVDTSARASPETPARNEDGLPHTPPLPIPAADEVVNGLNGSSPHASADAPEERAEQTAAEQSPPAEKRGA